MQSIENVPINSQLVDRFRGCLLGGAIGDALGSPTEGRTPHEILQRFGGRVEDFAPPFAAKPDGRHKGDGNITDDTLMVLALCRAYLAKGGQMEAHDMAEYFLPEVVDRPAWVPEFGREMLLLDRIFYPERYLFLRLRLASVNPREAGVGNMVNCGAAMYAAPVGLMNAGDSDEAYRRAINLFSAHQFSYGLEAAGIMAACVAEALRPDATVKTVIQAALRLSKDGTHAAIEAVVDAALQIDTDDESEVQQCLRSAMEPYDTVKGGVQEFTRTGAYPSQLHAIEELPLALGYIVWARGDFKKAVLGAVNYGRDSDSIAGMAGGIIGALSGASMLPARWIAELERRNRIDFGPIAKSMADLFIGEYSAARSRAARRQAELTALLEETGTGESK